MTSPGYPTLHDPTDPRQPPIHPGEELAGKYRIEHVIGAGAMGVVVRAWHIELEQPVAVKFLYPEFARNADGAERFRREARSAAKIKNQHVARVLDVGTLVSGAASLRDAEGHSIPYIVMEYLEGRDLAHELREQGPLPVAVAVRYVMQATEAVAEAHERGIVHRDLKPANLFLAEGARGERSVKVLDFGISKINGSGGAQLFSLTDTATLMGSPAYMSPEQLESSRNVDGRADIWSLGVILHELILGQVPFTGDSVPQLVRSILAGTRTTLLQRDASLLALESVVARCLCQEREQRFENAGALHEALRPFADHASSTLRTPPLTPPVSLTSRPLVSSPLPASPDAPAAGADRSEPAGTAGVPSAWGNTQRGRHRSWQRHAVPLLLLLSGVGVGGYWMSHLLAPPPLASVLPTESRLANTPAPHSEVPPKAPPPADPVPAAAGAQPLASPESDPPQVRVVSGAGGAAAVAPLQPAAALPQTAALPAPPKPLATPAVAPGTAAPVAPSTAKAPPAAKPALGVSPTGNIPPRALPAHANVPDQSDKPKNGPSPRAGAVDVPDFGGRE